jgi:predicted transcriptional regulator
MMIHTKGQAMDFRKEILLHLFNSRQIITDIRPLIKSLAMTRKEIIDTFSALEHDDILQSDKQWRKYKIISAGVEKTVDEVPFNFWLTPEVEQLVLNRYVDKPIIKIDNLHQGDNYGNYNQASLSNGSA